jgi:hypothetical protein
LQLAQPSALLQLVHVLYEGEPVQLPVVEVHPMQRVGQLEP